MKKVTNAISCNWVGGIPSPNSEIKVYVDGEVVHILESINETLLFDDGNYIFDDVTEWARFYSNSTFPNSQLDADILCFFLSLLLHEEWFDKGERK